LSHRPARLHRLAESISIKWIQEPLNPLPHGVLATFYPTARGPMGPPKKDDISREKTILMTTLRIYRASAVSSLRIHYTYAPSPPPIERSLYTLIEPDHSLADNILRI
jgi:hypothetical protein